MANLAGGTHHPTGDYNPGMGRFGDMRCAGGIAADPIVEKIRSAPHHFTLIEYGISFRNPPFASAAIGNFPKICSSFDSSAPPSSERPKSTSNTLRLPGYGTRV